MIRTSRLLATLTLGAALALAACAGSQSTAPTARTVTLVAYDSFPQSGTSLNEALEAFSARTGITVEILAAGDTGTMISKAVLTAGNPEGDVLWGVDQTFLTEALEAEIFAALPDLAGRADLDQTLVDIAPGAPVVPVDFGDVCINYDINWYAERSIPAPTSLRDLTDPRYAGHLVVQNPATSSPGLAMLLATVATFGKTGWLDWWGALADNGVEVTNGWTEAYYERFTWAGGGDQPMVVSYGSSPPAEVIFADPPRTDSPTAVIADSCFRQVEFAGILRGTPRSAEARALLEFLISPEFQAELPLTMFVFPANTTVALPAVFVEHAVIPADPLGVDAEVIRRGRADWIEAWTTVVLR